MLVQVLQKLLEAHITPETRMSVCVLLSGAVYSVCVDVPVQPSAMINRLSSSSTSQQQLLPNQTLCSVAALFGLERWSSWNSAKIHPEEMDILVKV